MFQNISQSAKNSKKAISIIKGITSKNGDFYYLNSPHLSKTKHKLESHKKVFL